MRTLKQIDAEIKEIENRLQDIGPKSTISTFDKEGRQRLSEYKKLESRLIFLRDCRLYISECESEDYLKRFAKKAEDKIRETKDRANALPHYRAKEYIKNSQVPALQKKWPL